MQKKVKQLGLWRRTTQQYFYVWSNQINSVFFVANAKNVHYLTAADGNPWVWVLGEDEDDKTDFLEVLKSKYY